MGNKTCLVVACYAGPRASHQPGLENPTDQPGLPRGESARYIEAHLHNLNKYYHETDVVFVIAEDGRQTVEIKETNFNITFIYRPNRGLSFGSWMEAYKTFRDKYDYYIFCEDDYVFIKDGFDAILRLEYEKQRRSWLQFVPLYIVNWAKGGEYREVEGTSTIGITCASSLSLMVDYSLEPPSSICRTTFDYKASAMWLFLSLVKKRGLDRENNAFPYWFYYEPRTGRPVVHMYGVEPEETLEQILGRAILCPYQMLDDNFNVRTDFVRHRNDPDKWIALNPL